MNEDQQSPGDVPVDAFVREGVEYRRVDLEGEDLAWLVYPGSNGDVLVDKGDGRGLVRPCQTPIDEYIFVSVRRNNGRYAQRRVHQLVARAFLGPPPSPAHVVDHVDGVPAHNGASNLLWRTARENCENRSRHMQRRRQTLRGRIRMVPVRMETIAEVQKCSGLKGQRLYVWVDRALREGVRKVRHAR